MQNTRYNHLPGDSYAATLRYSASKVKPLICIQTDKPNVFDLNLDFELVSQLMYSMLEMCEQIHTLHCLSVASWFAYIHTAVKTNAGNASIEWTEQCTCSVNILCKHVIYICMRGAHILLNKKTIFRECGCTLIFIRIVIIVRSNWKSWIFLWVI